MGKKITVIGIGRVGLPLCLSLAEAGFTVFGLDVCREHVEKIVSGEMPFMEKGAPLLLIKHVNKTFIPTLDKSCLEKSDIVIITLGTPVDEHLNPDYSQLDTVLPEMCKYLKKGQLIILRSTVAPGTTEFIADYLEKNTSLCAGKDFYLAFCPERIAEGDSLEEIKVVPQIIGGIGISSSAAAKDLFSVISKECLTTDARSAELAKIFTNMYRYINFAIANEFAILASEQDRDIHEIVHLINKDYKRGGVPPPGFAAGPCLFKDGFFLLNSIPFSELISTSWRINENFPLYLIGQAKEIMPLKDKKALILGLSFKRGSDDTRNSLSFKIKKALEREQCNVFLHDPHIKEYSHDPERYIQDADLIIIATNHEEFARYDADYLKKKAKKGCLVCDVWNITGLGRMVFRV